MQLQILELVNSQRSPDGLLCRENFETVKVIDVHCLEDAEKLIAENQIIYLPYQPKAIGISVPGDVVLSANGRVGVISGMVDQANPKHLVGFNMASVFRNESVIDPCNGGRTVRIASADLVNQQQQILYQFWNWKRGSASIGQSANYWMEVALWRWDGKV